MKPETRPNLYQLGTAIVFTILGILFSTEKKILAQVNPDNTLGQEQSLVIEVNELKSIINGGATRGQNLFHSFQEFNIGAGKSIYFSNPTGVKNILTRITGSNNSNILGTLGVEGSANLFL
ncbi:MAG: filamentous hemagglutinin N-terminal domain-containing protein, partial [Sphaerospermopsis sp. SIO1G2]|nr:filamentous hemagglutinin N-terminal domain-containing protein [Sphaerospermopsis sp. SIO1G2]